MGDVDRPGIPGQKRRENGENKHRQDDGGTEKGHPVFLQPGEENPLQQRLEFHRIHDFT
jgi:hypothetical protein